MKQNYQKYDSFVGKIAPFLLFEMEYHSLFYVVESHKDDRFYPEINPASQVACIGLVAYFEAFCKHQFAAIVNLMPSLVPKFCSKRNEPTVELSTVVSFNGSFEDNIGFVLSEAYDFGTAKAINGLFYDLIQISPFSKKEEETFKSIMYRRNLLVHHAGYYTLQYLKKNSSRKLVQQKAFKDAVKIDTEDYHVISDFLFEMAMKITISSVKAIKRNPSFKVLSSSKVEAVNELLQGINDSLDDF